MARRSGVALLAGLCLCAPAPGWAGVLSVEIVNGYNLIVDSNVTAPSTYAPKAAFIGARVCNTGAGSISNVFAYVGDYQAGVGDTPGIFPTATFASPDPRTQLWGTGSYSLSLEAGTTGTADGMRYIGTLAADECRMQYWLFSYPQCVNVGGQPQSPPCDVSIAGDVKPTDDPVLAYDVWARDNATVAGAVPAAQVKTRGFTLRNEISAAANKIWPNTTAKVPDEYLAAIQSVIGWGTLGPDGQPLTPTDAVYPGQRLITTQGIWYDLGNVGQGFDNDGDLVPDQNAWLQPVGDPGSFDADCFRMVNLYGIVIVKLKTGGELLIPFQNRLYFDHIPDNTGVVGLVYYQFVATDGVCNANMTPYQEAASGFDNEKFSADYGLALGLKSRSFGAGLTLTKTDGLTTIPLPPYTPLTYTINTENMTDNDGNPATTDVGVHIGVPDLGMPLVFRDSIPAGTTYLAGSAAAANTVPSTGAGYGIFTQGYTDRDGNLDTCTIHYRITSSAYTILYSTNGGSTWLATEPVPASTVTDIKWLLSTNLELDGGHDTLACVAPDGDYNTDPTDGTRLTSLPFDTTSTNARKAGVRFQITVSATAGPVLCNTARLGFGEAASGTSAQDCDLVTGNNSLSGTVFEDDGGVGGIYGNGTIEATEVGIGGVVVALYYDVNGDGKKDSGDLLFGTTTTGSGSNGIYSFSALPDGTYVVVVSKYNNTAGSGNDVNEMLASRCSPVGNCNDTAGWGNTTFDPSWPTPAEPQIRKMNEDLATVSLAVVLDPDKNSASQSLPNVNFGFGPPFRLTKVVTNNPDLAAPADVADTVIDEGDLFSYTILMENRLPSVGRQTPTGCEYVVWARQGLTGNSPKNFVTPGNAYDATSPNGSVASALVDGGGLRWLYGYTFPLAPQLGTITKVEGLFFGYYSKALTDDFLSLEVSFSANSNGLTTPLKTGTLSTSLIDSYVGAPAGVDPNSAIAWDISLLRPGCGACAVTDWSWTDFPNVYLNANADKIASADAKIFYLDAIGLRVSTDAACEASGSTTLSPVPLQDRYDIGRIAFVSADPAPASVNTSTGVIQWADVGPILPGSSRAVTVVARARNVTGTQTGSCAAFAPPTTEPPAQPGSTWANNCNYAQTEYTAGTTYHVKYADGRQANDDYDKMAITLQGKAELHGIVWNDNAAPTGWAKGAGEPGLPNVKVTLYACMRANGVTLEPNSSNKSCAAETGGNSWMAIATTVTSSSGAYDFIGLDTGHYLVEVGDSDGAPGTGNSSPYGGTQTAEANDTQNVTGGAANGHTCPACNNTWGDPAANLNTMNQLNAAAEEVITGVNFGYNNIAASLYGNVWHDIDASTVKDGGELGLSGFTVQLWSDPNADGNPADGTLQATATTDANGNYSFTGLSASSYVIEVIPPVLRSKSWVETVESTGGTGSLNSQIPVTLTSGQVSGSHDFGYTMKDTSSIGDTVYLDVDGNGVQDAGDAGIPNITVWLYQDVDRDGTIDAGVDALVATDVTDASGKYLFGPDETGGAQVVLAAGSYIVKVDTADLDFPTDVTPSADPDVVTGRIGDRVCFDADADGCEPAEDGIPNVVVVLYEDTNGNGSLNVGTDQLVAAATTDIDGNYLFTGLHAGSYFVDVADDASDPNGNSLPASRQLSSTQLALFGTDPKDTLITLATNSSAVLTADAGYSPSSTYAMGNRVWSDANGNGVPDPGEPGIPGVTISVTNGTGSGCATACTATTDAAGLWMVTGLGNGTFNVDVVSTVANVLDAPRSLRLTNGTEPRTGATAVTIASADRMDVDFGYRYDTDGTVLNDRDAGDPTGTIDGRVFVDVNGDSAYSSRTVSAGTTNGSATVASAGLFLASDVGASISGAGIPGGATITAFVNASQIIISAAATATGTPTLTVADPVRAGTTVNLLDENGYIVATTTTGTNGRYYFGGTATCTMTSTPACSAVFIGEYSVQAVDSLGTRYSTIFVSSAQSFPNLNVVYSRPIETVPDSLSSVSVDGVHADLMQDFGYQRFLGSIGDTVYLDANGNGTQDPGEPGIGGVTVRLYMAAWNENRTLAATTTAGSAVVGSAGLFLPSDLYASISGPGIPNGATVIEVVSASSITISAVATATGTPTVAISGNVFESGEWTSPVLQQTATTTSDNPLTPADEGGKYLFANLATPPAGQHYVVQVVTSTIAGTPTLTADPDTDGTPCQLLPDPDVQGDAFPPPGVCDSEQLVAGFTSSMNYLGADFGYQITGSGFGVLGDHLWIDTDGDGVVDSGEPGIRYLTVYIDTGAAGFLWADGNGNARWDAGEGDQWVQTDSDGYYLFTGLADGGHVVRVLTSDPDWPSGLPTTPTYEAGTGSYDNSVTATLTGGLAVITGGSCPSNCNLEVDFGYRYAGTNTLSGTVCMDDGTNIGYCGATATTYSGVDVGESPLAGIQVGLYRWTDDGDNTAWTGGTLDAGDTFTFLGATSTDANGDYSFSNVPPNVVVVLSVVDTQNLRLTTSNANTSQEGGGTSQQLYEGTTTYEGNTVTVLARQALSGLGATNQDVDYAFDGTLGGTLLYDFGDLPETGTPDFQATLLTSGGARHRVTGTSIYLGTGVTAETDGLPSATAAGELDVAADGVALITPTLTLVPGPAGGTVQVTASAAGWLGAWIDFNEDGDFADAGERIIDRPVAAGSGPISFDVPYDILGGSTGPFTAFARFRIYPSEPLMVSATGVAMDATFQPVAGEVEDYAWDANVTQAVISSFTARDRSGAVALEWRTSSEVGTVGFFLRRWDEAERRYVEVNSGLIPALLTAPQGGSYRSIDVAAQPGVSYLYEIVEAEASGRRNTHGPFTVNTAWTAYDDREAVLPEPDASGVSRAPHASHVTAARAQGRARATRDVGVGDRSPAQQAKIAVAETGIYYVGLQDLASRGGLAVDRLIPGRTDLFGLTNRGKAVPFAWTWDLSGLVFYGQEPDSVFAQDNVYRTSQGRAARARMRVRTERPGPSPRGDETFARTVHLEQDLEPAMALYDDPERDYWLWDYVFAGWGAKSFSFRTDGAVSGGEASLKIRLRGGSETDVTPDHHAVIRLNGQQIGELSWDGLAAADATFGFSPSLLRDGENSLEIDGLTDTGAPYSIFFLDWFDVRYASRYRARGNRLECSSGSHSSLRIDGFTRPDVMVFDITDPRRPEYVQAPVSPTGDGSFGVSLFPPAPERVYYAVTPDALLAATGIEPDAPSALKRADTRGEYLVVTTAALKAAAQKLADYRGDLTSQVVDIVDVYDEFNFGIASPHALKAFLSYARSHWLVPPRYVVLVGDGSYDYKDALGFGGNLIPPMMVKTLYGLSPSDAWFVGVDSAGRAPEMAIGRLPVSTVAELEQVIAKIQTREASTSPWLGRMLAVADNPDAGGNFPLDSERIAALAPVGVQVDRVGVADLGPAQARARLLAGINEGAGMISYVGHGGVDVLAEEGLLSNDDVALLQNAELPTVLTSLTCMVGHFAVPGYPSLGALLVRNQTGGAAAVWAPTGLSQNEFASQLGRGYYRAVTGEARIGDAVKAAIREYYRVGGPSYLPPIYVLLGDPAMRLR